MSSLEFQRVEIPKVPQNYLNGVAAVNLHILFPTTACRLTLRGNSARFVEAFTTYSLAR